MEFNMEADMDLHEAILSRRTTNGHFQSTPIKPEHQRRLMEAASAAPSHFNSQPWRFCLIEAPEKIAEVAEISGRSMTQLIDQGIFFQRYRRYFRFSQKEVDERRDGIYIDHLPAPLRPFTKQLFSDAGIQVMRTLGVPKKLGEDNRKLVAGSPLLLAVMLDKNEYIPQALSGFYSIFGMGAAMENIWLTVATLKMGIQFISTPMELPEEWQRIKDLIKLPSDLELMAVYRLGYLPFEQKRPNIDWSSRERKRFSQYVYREDCQQPQGDEW